jgi:hypothetical protein
MQHPILRATILSFFAGYGMSSAALAGQPHGQGYSADHITHVSQTRYHGHIRVGASSGGFAPDAVRGVNQQRVAPQPAFLLPLPAQIPARQTLGIDSETTVHSYPRHSPQPQQRRELEMLSGNAVSPGTILYELPSGSIVMQSPAQRFGYYHHRGHRNGITSQHPYAPPSFQIVGQPSVRHMGNPVKLTYGTPVQKRLNPAPRVIWIKAESTGKPIQVIK